MPETNKHRFVRTLREVAEFVESRPFAEDLDYPTLSYFIFCQNGIQFGEAVAAAGSCKKSDGGKYLNADISIGDTKLQITIRKEYTCERVKVGEKIIPAMGEYVVPAKPERTEDVFEYECPDSFLQLKEGGEEVTA